MQMKIFDLLPKLGVVAFRVPESDFSVPRSNARDKTQAAPRETRRDGLMQVIYRSNDSLGPIVGRVVI